MKSFLGGHVKARNNEEYREILKKRQLSLWIMCIGGLITFILGLTLFLLDSPFISAFQAGVLSGVGTGLFLGSVAGIIRIYRTLANEEKLKTSRLKETDERELEVNSMALRATARIILFCLYVMMVVGAILDSVIMNVSGLLIGIFLITYYILRFYYQRKM